MIVTQYLFIKVRYKLLKKFYLSHAHKNDLNILKNIIIKKVIFLPDREILNCKRILGGSFRGCGSNFFLLNNYKNVLDAIEMYVDGEKYGEVDPGEGFYQEAVKHNVTAATRWLKGSAMAPFDELVICGISMIRNHTLHKRLFQRSIFVILSFVIVCFN